MVCFVEEDVEKLKEECISLVDKLKDGDLDENMRHLKYKFDSFSKVALKKLKERTSTIDMLLKDLKESQLPSIQHQLGSGRAGKETIMKL